MEVHHSQHPTHKKKWTEYLLEFFMLFLAVFLGFVAENIREHIVEKERGRQYMHSLIEDLKVDTSSLSANISARQHRSMIADSLILLLSSASAKENGNSIYYYARSISPPINFFPNDRTI
jgi:hypothetical protein